MTRMTRKAINPPDAQPVIGIICMATESENYCCACH